MGWLLRKAASPLATSVHQAGPTDFSLALEWCASIIYSLGLGLKIMHFNASLLLEAFSKHAGGCSLFWVLLMVAPIKLYDCLYLWMGLVQIAGSGFIS